jgi:hypothetical protein
MMFSLAAAVPTPDVVREFVVPIVTTLGVLASLACVFFLIIGGITYMTSAGNPQNLMQAKRIIRNALIGLVMVLGAGTLTAILGQSFGNSNAEMATHIPVLTPISPTPVSNGLVEVLIKAITGLLNAIIQSVAAPFLSALTFFTTATPLMAENSHVFNLWLIMVGIADSLFIFIVALIGFHVMSAATFGFDEVEFRHLLPRLGLVFLLMNTSIFAIDTIIKLSNVLIKAIHMTTGGANSIWEVLTEIVKQASGQGVAALLIMVVFVIFSVILLVYYVGRIVTLYIGAVLSPIVLLIWLLPGFRDFSESAIKTYCTTIFVLFVHVVILQLAASLFVGMVQGTDGQVPDVIMSMVIGLATILALLKTQGLMMQFSYVSMGARNTKRLGKEFISGVSYLGGTGKTIATKVQRRTQGNPLSKKPKITTPRQGEHIYTSSKKITPSQAGTARPQLSLKTKPKTAPRRPPSKPIPVAKILKQPKYTKK